MRYEQKGMCMYQKIMKGGRMLATQGIVFNIQRYTIHDGPGLRTELFLKGCPLRCQWCSNPESWIKKIQPGVYKTKCISKSNCGACEEICEENAINFYRGKIQSIDREKCTNCMKCYDECPSDAVKRWGETMSVEDCMKIIMKDKGFYEHSGGGVTVSGGEPLLQSDFVAELFKVCKEKEIHTCCESTMHAPWKEIEKILPYTDLLISDLKHMDSNIHKKYTGVGNELILKNLKNLITQGRELILRIPVIPNVNDNEENIKASADFILNELDGKVRTLQLLSFMRLGEEKYTSLGIPYGMKDVKINRKIFQKHVEEIAEYFNSRGIHCLVGTKEKE